MKAHRRLAAALAVLVVVLAGCTGVPSTSPPEVVTTVGGGEPVPSLAITPPPGAGAREIVSDFLVAGTYPDNNHAAARGFLTTAAVQSWNDTPVTIVATDSVQVSNFKDGTVVVNARKVGTLGQNGVYVPDLKGDGSGADQITVSFGLREVNGEWRIDQIQNGLIMKLADFQSVYHPIDLYFFDQAGQHLVPDLRFTAITDHALLASWLVGQLVLPPRPDLQANNATAEYLPNQTDPTRVGVVLGSTAQVSIPGAARLSAAKLFNLAAQLSITLQPVAAQVSIVDSGKVVPIPQLGATSFTPAEFTTELGPVHGVPTLYYLNGGKVYDSSGAPLPGRAQGQYELTSVALKGTNPATMQLAGTAATGNQSWLYVGTASGGLQRTTVHGQLSRPAWAPDVPEVWVGDGATLYRAASGHAKPVPVPVSTVNGTVSGRFAAVRFSPEGTRIALVVASPDGSAQVWVGAVLRPTGGTVSVVNLQQISPQGVSVTDVAWNGQLKLFATGHNIATGESGIYEVQVDGSLWTPRGNGNLPGPADSITIAEVQNAWVSTGQTVWVQSGFSWTSPRGGQTPGTNPVYTE